MVDVSGCMALGIYDESSLEGLCIYVCMYVCTHRKSWLSSMRWGVVCPLLGPGISVFEPSESGLNPCPVWGTNPQLLDYASIILA